MKLYMVILGCVPPGRNTEQHDVFFGIADSLKELVPHMNDFWKEAAGRLHIDAWREVTHIDGYTINVVNSNYESNIKQKEKLFFINLGGYKQNEFEEYHYKVLAVATDKSKAIARSKETTFFKHCGFKDARSHVDDKYGVDIDDVYEIGDILSTETKEKYSLIINPSTENLSDELHIGYLKFNKLLSQ